MIIDTHAHLDAKEFDRDRDDVVKRAAEAGVTRIVTVGVDIESSREAVEMADAYPGVYAAVGVHPTSAHTVTEEGWIDVIRKLAGHPKVVAIGEIGLDYYHPPRGGLDDAAYRARQSEFFTRQLELAVELGMNVVVHQRSSSEDTSEHVRPFDGRLRAVFHCFSGTPDEAAELVRGGHLVSFTGIASFKNASDVHEVVRRVPAGQFMVETDAPYLAPVPFRGKRCEPAYTRQTVEAVAALRGETLAEVAKSTSEAALKFFKGLG